MASDKLTYYHDRSGSDNLMSGIYTFLRSYIITLIYLFSKKLADSGIPIFNYVSTLN